MNDPRIQKLARVLVNYSVDLKSGEEVMISTETPGLPLAYAAYEEALKLGARPNLRITDPYATRLRIKYGNEEQLNYIPEYEKVLAKTFDAQIYISAPVNAYTRSGLNPESVKINAASQSFFTKTLLDRDNAGELRWCIVRFPNQTNANLAKMSLDDYEEFVYKAGLINENDPVEAWKQQQQRQDEIIAYLSQHDEIHLLAPGTDLKYRTKGRTWTNACGKRNFPDGEVFTSPIEESVEGVVTFSYPAIYAGNSAEGVTLTFRQGKVIEATAKRGQEFLESVLNTDEGARFLGEAAIGTNYMIDRFSEDVLFDEKIGGTIHLALGLGFAANGGKNVSAIHWDMVADMREGKIFADGELFYQNGRFLI